MREQIEKKDYNKFVLNLLDLHYDKVYKRIQNYRTAYRQIKLNSIDNYAFEILLKKLNG